MVVKNKIGTVVSDKMENTIIVAVSDRVPHKLYKKVITQTKRYVVHNDNFNARIGDKVKIREVRPISRTKNWILLDVLEKTST